MIMGRITGKSQTTVPRAVRLALGLKPGDAVIYELDGDHAVLRRAPSDHDMFVNNFSTFTEWDSEADRIGFANF